MIILPILALLSNLNLCGKDPQLIICVAYNIQGTYTVTHSRDLEADLPLFLLRHFLQLLFQPFGDIASIIRDHYTLPGMGTTHGFFFWDSDIEFVDH